eukprot:365856-Chlamydomonas_euryale.AAC.7
MSGVVSEESERDSERNGALVGERGGDREWEGKRRARDISNRAECLDELGWRSLHSPECVLQESRMPMSVKPAEQIFRAGRTTQPLCAQPHGRARSAMCNRCLQVNIPLRGDQTALVLAATRACVFSNVQPSLAGKYPVREGPSTALAGWAGHVRTAARWEETRVHQLFELSVKPTPLQVGQDTCGRQPGERRPGCTSFLSSQLSPHPLSPHTHGRPSKPSHLLVAHTSRGKDSGPAFPALLSLWPTPPLAPHSGAHT